MKWQIILIFNLYHMCCGIRLLIIRSSHRVKFDQIIVQSLQKRTLLGDCLYPEGRARSAVFVRHAAVAGRHQSLPAQRELELRESPQRYPCKRRRGVASIDRTSSRAERVVLHGSSGVR